MEAFAECLLDLQTFQINKADGLQASITTSKVSLVAFFRNGLFRWDTLSAVRSTRNSHGALERPADMHILLPNGLPSSARHPTALANPKVKYANAESRHVKRSHVQRGISFHIAADLLLESTAGV